MKEHPSTHQLSSNDLLLLQKHVKLGKKHIESCLSKEEIDTLFQWVKIDRKVEKKLAASSMELTSNVSMVYNSILTGTLGFWLGLSGLLKWELFSNITLIFLLLPIAIGAFIGCKVVSFKKRSTQGLLDKIKYKDLEIQIIKTVNEYREKEINFEKTNIINSLKRIDIDFGDRALEYSSEKLIELCLVSISTLKIKKNAANQIEKEIELEDECKEINDGFKKIAEKLSKHTISNRVNLRSWIKSNFNRLLIELTPTMIGGASSLFVYIGGTRKLTEEIGPPSWVDFLERPQTKQIELIFLSLITLYFVFSFLYQNYKNYKREHEIAEAEAHLIQEEKKLDLLNNELIDLKKYATIIQTLGDSR